MRALLYLLAAMLFDDPRPENRETRRALLTRVRELSSHDSPWILPLLEISQEEDGDEQRCEYARLFLLTEPCVVAQPYGSYWLEPERRLMGETTLKVARLMHQHGVRTEEDSGLLPDHLVCELEFMAYLADREQEEITTATQETLLREHLCVWIPAFLDALQICRPSHHYRMAGLYLKEIIAWDKRRFGIGPTQRPVAA